MNIPIAGIRISLTEEAIWISSRHPLATIASAPVGGGLTETRHILNVHVDKNYEQKDPVSDLASLARRLGITETFIGLMTAVYTHQARVATAQSAGLIACTVATAGMSNACAAGITPPAIYANGTINLITLVDANLCPAALVNAVMSATEAKCDLLRRLARRTASGEIATGTSTDAIVIAATGSGSLLPFAGPATEVGWLIASSVRQALEAALG